MSTKRKANPWQIISAILAALGSLDVVNFLARAHGFSNRPEQSEGKNSMRAGDATRN